MKSIIAEEIQSTEQHGIFLTVELDEIAGLEIGHGDLLYVREECNSKFFRTNMVQRRTANPDNTIQILVDEVHSITADEFNQEMNYIKDEKIDLEGRHRIADKLLILALKHFGEDHEEGITIFRRMSKWYA